MATEYKIGDLVWAKMKGFPPWPGVIAEPSKDMKGKLSGKKTNFWIYFFGTKNFGWIDASNLKPYLPHKVDLKKAAKSAVFKEACEAIEDVQLKGEASPFNPKSEDHAFDRLVSESTPPPRTPKSTGESSGSKSKSSSKKKSAKIDKGKRHSASARSEHSESTDGETEGKKSARKRSKSSKETPRRTPARSQKFSDKNSSQSETAAQESDLSSEYEDFQSTSSARKTSVPRSGSSLLGKSKRPSSSRQDSKRFRSQNYSDADTTTPANWQIGGVVDYSSTSVPKRAAASLLDRPPNITRPETPPLDLNTVSQTLLDKNITPSNLKFGFLGLGVMGSGIVKNLLNSGHRVVVWNRTPEKSTEFMKAGAEMALTPQDVVQAADITFSCVSDPQAAKDMMFGNCGALSEVNSSKSYVEMTSIDNETSKDLSEAVTSRGGRYLEAQLQGSKQEAEEGTLIILSAGDRSLYNECHSCFEAFGRSSFFLGEVGSASKMNLVIQLITGVVLAGLAESLALADKTGLQLPDVLEIMGLTNLNCPYILEKGKCIINCAFGTDHALTHMQKDLNLVLGISQQVDQPLPMAAIANEVFKHAKRLGYGDHDAAAVFIRARF